MSNSGKTKENNLHNSNVSTNLMYYNFQSEEDLKKIYEKVMLVENLINSITIPLSVKNLNESE